MPSRATTILQTQKNAQMEIFSQSLDTLFQENRHLEESLENVQAMFAKEDMGWVRFGGERNEGLELHELHDWARQIHEAVAGNAHIKQGYRLRTNYVWEGGCKYGNVDGTKKGRGTNVQARIDQPRNQRNFFGKVAREQREGSLYSAGTVFYLGDKRDFTLQPIPVWEIRAFYTNPDDMSEVWAFQRMWTHWVPGTGAIQQSMWYLTDLFPEGEKPSILNLGGMSAAVDPNKTMFEAHVNGQIGWPLGIPDALAALMWARIYRDFVINGKIMSDALAQFAFQATVASKKGATNAQLAYAEPAGPGATAVVGAADSLVPISSAGKGYDFGSGDALLAVVAAALEVSAVHLSANPSSAGSYGSVSTLDLPTKLAVLARREWHAEFDKRVLTWMGAKNPTVTFNSLNDSTDIFREIQALLLAWASGLYEGEPIEKRVSDLLSILDNTIPAGVITPNNSEGKWLLSPDQTADPNAAPVAGADPQDPSAPPAAGQGGVSKPNGTSPSQGKTSPAGKAPKPNDLRSDKLANGLTMPDMMAMLKEFIDSEEALRKERERPNEV